MAAELPPDSELFIVEDDASLRELLARQFTLEGFRVTTFAAGAPFLAAANTRAAACVLLDVRMPDVSGLEVLRQLNVRHYAAPVFMISGWGDVPIVVDAVKSGATDFFEKPFDIVDVVRRVRAAVAAWSRCKDVRHVLFAAFPRSRAADAARARHPLSHRQRRLEQGDRPQACDQSAHGGGTSRAHHEETRGA